MTSAVPIGILRPHSLYQDSPTYMYNASLSLYRASAGRLVENSPTYNTSGIRASPASFIRDGRVRSNHEQLAN